MADETAGTASEVREGYAWQQPGWRDGSKREARRAEFDRWLAEHDARVRADVVAEMSGPHRCCEHCADDPVHDVEKDHHELPCTLCDTEHDRAVRAREGLTQTEFDAQLDALAEDAWEHYHDTWRRTR